MINQPDRYRIIFLILLCGTAIIIWVRILLSPPPENPKERPAQRQAFLSVVNRA